MDSDNESYHYSESEFYYPDEESIACLKHQTHMHSVKLLQ